jgi:hypothetical protein
VPYRVGREGREAYGEQYAGRLFSEKGTKCFTGSTGVGDDAVQAYDYRLCLTDDPDNRRPIEQPAGYDRTEFLPIIEDGGEDAPGSWDAHTSTERACHLKSELVRPGSDEIEAMGFKQLHLLRGPLPNDKRDLNTADLPGAVDDYPEADWERREEIAQRHREHVLGLLYFFQNDAAVPDSLQQEANRWGLPEDEFEDNAGFPFQLYVREGRRIEGRTTFTEHDARLTEGLDRAPIAGDSIAIGEYPMDSHDCRPVRRPGTLADGHHYLGEITVPSQIPYEAMLPANIDNLLVPVALSATHVGFGTVRLEPTWFQLGEAAGYAAALAADRATTPGALDASALQRRLVADGAMLTYFEDVAVDPDDSAAAAAQYLGTRGFFRGYTARLDEPLGAATAERWATFAAALRAGASERSPTDRARALPADGGEPVTADRFCERLREAFEARGLDASVVDEATAAEPSEPITRGDACVLVYRLVA